MWSRRAWGQGLAAGLLLAASPLRAQSTPPWPAEVAAALAAAQVPPEAVGFVLQEIGGTVRAQWQAERPMNPASLFKLVTTYAALDLLGPAWRWSTPVWLDGTLEADTLRGHLVIQGGGDPKLTPERVWQLLRRVRQLGVRHIHGDIVLDRRAFAPPTGKPGDFDGEPLRAHNVQADALLLAQKTQVLTFTPEAATGLARVSTEVPLDGVRIDATVPLADGGCGDWRAALLARRDDARQMRLDGLPFVVFPVMAKHQLFVGRMFHGLNASGSGLPTAPAPAGFSARHETHTAWPRSFRLPEPGGFPRLTCPRNAGGRTPPVPPG